MAREPKAKRPRHDARYHLDSEEVKVPYGPDQQPWHASLSEMAVTRDGELLLSPPTSDPLQLESYPEVPGITSAWYQVPSSGLSPEQRQRAVKETLSHLSHGNHLFLGSGANLDFNCDPVKNYTDCMTLTGGDPFTDGPCGLNMKWMERNALDFLASLWHAKWPHNPQDPESYWGYTMSLDTTEASYYGLRNVRDYLSGKFVVRCAKPLSSDTSQTDPRQTDVYTQGKFESTSANAYSPVVFYSTDVHRSIPKATHAINIPSFYEVGTRLYPDENPLGGKWPVAVPCEGGDGGPGSIDIPALTKLVDFFSGKGHPIAVVFNYGSSFKGACDDIKAAGEALIPILKENGMFERQLYLKSAGQTSCVTRRGFWFHIDGSLAALYMPFLEMAYHKGLTKEKPGPVFDFRLDFVSSLTANCHSWLGSPWPFAVYMTRMSHQLRASMGLVSHFGFFDSALSGARYGLSMLVLWSHFSSSGYDKLVERVVQCLAAAQQAEQKLKDLEQKMGLDLWVLRAPHSLTVCFRKPNDAIVQKFHLRCRVFCVNGEIREYVRIGQIDEQKLSLLLDDLQNPSSFLSGEH